MIIEKIKLCDVYPFLDNNGAEPTVTAYIQQELLEESLRFERPAMIVCPGGAYAYCSLRESEPVAIQFLKLGFNVFVLNYSVAPHKFPQAICEVAATVDLIHKNAHTWHIDKQKIAICGFSAGGHLAASYCTLRKSAEVKALIDAKPVQAAVLCYPVITADPTFCHHDSIKNISGSKEITPDVINKFSLDRHVSSELTPPTFIWHTFADAGVSVKNSIVYAEALTRAQIPFELHIFPNGAHGMSTCDRQTLANYNDEVCKYNSAWLTLADKWLKQQFNV